MRNFFYRLLQILNWKQVEGFKNDEQTLCETRYLFHAILVLIYIPREKRNSRNELELELCFS